MVLNWDHYDLWKIPSSRGEHGSSHSSDVFFRMLTYASLYQSHPRVFRELERCGGGGERGSSNTSVDMSPKGVIIIVMDLFSHVPSCVCERGIMTSEKGNVIVQHLQTSRAKTDFGGKKKMFLYVFLLRACPAHGRQLRGR